MAAPAARDLGPARGGIAYALGFSEDGCPPLLIVFAVIQIVTMLAMVGIALRPVADMQEE